ncbi:MAG: 4-alpha-glucanotransferase [Candidatus Omnitrophica bacterium]|nr:4-alpha-glucanotransferase [Candidatus Omnitrophota bacterium]
MFCIKKSGCHKFIVFIIIQLFLSSSLSQAAITSAILLKESSCLSPAIHLQQFQVRDFYQSDSILLSQHKNNEGISSTEPNGFLRYFLRTEEGAVLLKRAVDVSPASKTPKIEKIIMNLVPGDNVAIGLGDKIELDVIIVTTPQADFVKDELAVAVHTNMDTAYWHDINIAAEDINRVYDKKGKIIPGVFSVRVSLIPEKAGNYKFNLRAKTKNQKKPVWLEGKKGETDIYVQVLLTPKWFKAEKFHPYYIYRDDVTLCGYKADWTGIKRFVDDRFHQTGKNVFILSPFFSVLAEGPTVSPFAPTSVFAQNRLSIDWDAVEDKGDYPADKFRNFQKYADEKRKKAFMKFSRKEQIQQYARFEILRKHQSLYNIGINQFNPAEVENMTDEFFEGYTAYQQFINLEQFYKFLRSCHEKGIIILGDMPYYESINGVDAYFNKDYFTSSIYGGIESPGHRGVPDQFWTDLAVWDEHWIKTHVDSGGEDPRMRPFKYWDTIFREIFGEEAKEIGIGGWRIDAPHMYGRGSFFDDARRIYYDTTLWDSLADYFQKNDLLAVIEQLGGDKHAYDNFERLGFFQYAFILDLKPKKLPDFLADLANISRGRAFTVVDTHDSYRWAREYWQMFESLTDTSLEFSRYAPKEEVQEFLELIGPAFFALKLLGPKIETLLLSLDEFGTTDRIKKETKNYGVVDSSHWGTETIGPVDFSKWIKAFIEIRENNPAVSHSEMIVIPNNDNKHLVSVAKAYEGNNLLIMANFSRQPKRIAVSIPAQEFQVGPSVSIIFKDLITEEKVRSNPGLFNYNLAPGQVCVFRQERVENRIQEWLRQNFLPVIDDPAKRLSAETMIREYRYDEKIETKEEMERMFRILLPEGFNAFFALDWDEHKNKEIMLHSKEVLYLDNGKPFIAFVKDKQGNEHIIPSFPVDEGEKHVSMLFGLKPGSYVLKFFWLTESEFGGEKSRDYHFRVLPEAEEVGKPGELNEFALQLSKEDFAQYPYSTVTLANGRGSILRLPVRPLERKQWDGAIEVSGFTSKYDGFQANLSAGFPDEKRKIIFRGAVDDAVIKINGKEKGFHLDMETFDNFARYPLPRWRFVLRDGEEEVVIDKSVALVEGENRYAINYKVVSATAGVENITLFVRPDINMRDHHEPAKHWEGAVEFWNSKHRNIDGRGFRIYPVNDEWKHWYPGFDGIKMTAATGSYQHASEWHYSLDPIESERGQDNVNDAYSPGFFTIPLSLGKDNSSSLIFSCVDALTKEADYSQAEVEALIQERADLLEQRISKVKNPEARKDSFVQKMVAGVWPFVAKRDEFYTVIAGYPWFSDWGRDTFLCFEGLLSAGMNDIAKGLLMAFGKFEKNGMLPNIITGETAGNWDTVDAPLLYVLSVKNYIDETGDKAILDELTGDRTVLEKLISISEKYVGGEEISLKDLAFSTLAKMYLEKSGDLNILTKSAGGRTILEIIESIMRGYYKGTENGIAMDANSKLIWSPSHFTWMDTNYPACTSRQGYTAENNARWHDVLRFLGDIYEERGDAAKSSEFKNIALEVKDNFNKYFWIDREGGYLADVIECEKGKAPGEGRQDIAFRPNQLITVLSPYGILSKERQKKVVDIVKRKLLVPGGIRTLSEDTASSSQFPYRGYYEGDEDTQRKQAYHNGTVWPHLFGDWALAYVIAHDYSEESIRYVLPYFAPLEEHLRIAGVGSVSEIRDGNYPHWPRGCSDQAWSVAMNLAAYMRIRYSGSTTFRHSVTDEDQNELLKSQKTMLINKTNFSIEHSI